MKRKVLLIFILFCFLCACNKTSEIEKLPDNDFNTEIKSNSGVPLNIRKYEFYGTTEEIYQDEREKFYSEIKERYNVDLKVFGIGVRGYSEELNTNTNLWSISADIIEYHVNTGQIAPIDEYLKDNIIWQNLPEFIRNAHKYHGKIYGISIFERDFPFTDVRFIRNDWLDELNLEIPRTIDEYYEVMYRFTYDDPNNNKINDTTGFISLRLGGLYDIFSAFDCRIQKSGGVAIYQPAWNPNTGKIEDALSKVSMEECLEYLNMCYENKLLSIKSHITKMDELTKVYNRGIYGSMANLLHLNDDITKSLGTNHSIIVGLEGISKKNIILAYLPSNDVYVLPTTTVNKTEVINSFVNIFMGDEYGYFIGKYGIPGSEKGDNDFYIENDTVYITREVTDNISKKKKLPNIIEYVPPYNSYEVKYYADGKIYEDSYVSNYERNEYNRIFYEYSDKIFLEPYEYMSKLMTSNLSWIDIHLQIRELGEKTIRDSIIGEVSIKDALSFYKEKAKELGLHEIIENVNQLIDNKN